MRALLVAAASLVVALFLGELALRLWYPVAYHAPVEHRPDPEWRTLIHRRSSVPGLRYELVPDLVQDVRGMHVETNALGMRGPAVGPRADGVVRIAALGDSVTFGYGVAADQAWPAVLARLLTEQDGGRTRYEALNFGVSGYSTRDEAAVLEHKVLPLAPDLVVLGYFLNDPDYEPYQQLHRWFRGTLWWEHFHLARLVARWSFDRERQRDGHGDLYRYYHAPRSDRWRSVLDAFDSMQRSTVRTGVRVLVVIFPPYVGFSGWPKYPYEDVHAQVRAAAEARGFAVLDLVPDFVDHAPSPADMRLDNEHPNARGHQLAAEAIARSIEEQRAALLPHAR